MCRLCPLRLPLWWALTPALRRLTTACSAVRHRQRTVWLTVWLLGLCWPALAPAADAPAEPASVLILREALAVAGRPERFPADAQAVPIILPAQGKETQIVDDEGVWLRLRFDRPAGLPAGTLLAAHLPMSCGWMDVDLNGQAVHRDAIDPVQATSVCPRPRLFALPAAALRATGNLLDIQLRGPQASRVSNTRRSASMSEVWVGSHAALVEAQSSAGFWQVTALRVVDVVLLMFGGFMLALSLATRRSLHLAWFGLTSLTWAAVLAPVWWTALPIASGKLELLLLGLLAPTVAFAVHFLMRFIDRPVERLMSWILLLQCGLVPASFALADADHRLSIATVWAVALSLEMTAGLAVYLKASWTMRRSDAWTMGSIVALATLVWVIDIVERPDGMEWWATLQWAIGSPYGWSVLLMALGVRLMYLFSQTLVAAELSRLSLESQVREITAEIEHNFAQLSEMRVEQVTEQERKRIAADLHDDLGAKLLTIVHTCDNERIATLGREALDEMRLSVRGLSGRPMRLGDAMADWRAETVQRLGQTNIQVEWESPGDDVDHILPARAFVQTTRILREAVSNIIKHSGASRCEVKCFAGDGEYGLVVEDNGRGIPVAFDGGLDRGHGMSSMKHRAKQLQGQCLVESAAGAGTVIRLTLPL